MLTMVKDVGIYVNFMVLSLRKKVCVKQLQVKTKAVPQQVNFWAISQITNKLFNMQCISTLTDPCANWPDNYFEKNTEPDQTLINELYQYGRQNLALIHIMVQSPYVTKIKRDVAMPFITFVANSGGLLGLCIGFSFISAVEILFWISCCCRSCSKIAFCSWMISISVQWNVTSSQNISF